MDWNALKALWNKATSCRSRHDNEGAIAVYAQMAPHMRKLETIRPRRAKQTQASFAKDVLFSKMMWHHDVAGAHSNEGNFTIALKHAKHAIRLRGEMHFPAVNLVVGHIYFNAHKYKSALDWYDKALLEYARLYSNDGFFKNKVVCQIAKGECFFFLNRLVDAEASFASAIAAKTDYFEPYFFMAEICTRRGDSAESEAYRKRFATRRKRLTPAAFAARTKFYPPGLSF